MLLGWPTRDLRRFAVSAGSLVTANPVAPRHSPSPGWRLTSRARFDNWGVGGGATSIGSKLPPSLLRQNLRPRGDRQVGSPYGLGSAASLRPAGRPSKLCLTSLHLDRLTGDQQAGQPDRAREGGSLAEPARTLRV